MVKSIFIKDSANQNHHKFVHALNNNLAVSRNKPEHQCVESPGEAAGFFAGVRLVVAQRHPRNYQPDAEANCKYDGVRVQQQRECAHLL